MIKLLSILFLSWSVAHASFTEPPSVTTTVKNTIPSPRTGSQVFDSTLGIMQYYNGTQWIANTSIQLDNVYSAKVSATGVVSDESKDFINGNASFASGTATVTFTSGVFTVTPNCTVNITNANGNVLAITSQSASSIVVQTQGAAADRPFNIICEKQGADYQSADAYIASNGNYSRTAFTPTFTGFGTPSSVECYHSRDGEYLDMNCSFVAGTTTGVEARVSLPSGLTTTSTPTTRFAAGHYALSSGNSFSGEILAQPGQTYITFGQQAVGATATANTQTASTLLSNGTLLTFSARIPISGWTNSNLIVASLQGTPNIPGSTTAVDTFSVAYGTTNIATPCSGSPCFIDQIGTAVSSITRSGAGQYTLNTAATYTKLRCTGSGASRIFSDASCNNCSSIAFTSVNIASVLADSNGALICQGSR